MANPDDANKSTVTITKKDGTKVTQTTVKGPGGTRTYRDGKLVYNEDRRSGQKTRPDKVQAAKPVKEQIGEQFYLNDVPVSKAFAEQYDKVKNAKTKESSTLAQEAQVFYNKIGQPGPNEIVQGATTKKKYLDQNKFYAGTMGLMTQEGNVAYSRAGNYVAVLDKKSNTLFYTKGFNVSAPESEPVRMFANIRAAVQPGGRKKAAQDIEILRKNALNTISKIQFGAKQAAFFNPSQQIATDMAAGVAKDYVNRPVSAPLTDIAITVGSFGIGKGVGFLKGLNAGKPAATSFLSKSAGWAVKGAGKGFMTGIYGLAAFDIATNKKPAERAGVVLKEFALFGAGTKLGFKSGLGSAVKFKQNLALKKAKSLTLFQDLSLSKDVRVLARVKEVKGLTLVQQSRAGLETQRSFVNYGPEKWVNARNLPRTDFVRLSGQQKIQFVEFDYGLTQKYASVYQGVGRGTVEFKFPTKSGLIQRPARTSVIKPVDTLLSNKAWQRSLSQADIGFGKSFKIKPTSTSTKSVVNLQVEGLQFSPERAVYNPAGPVKPPKFKLLARSKPLNPMQSGSILEWYPGVKKPTSFQSVMSLKAQRAFMAELSNNIAIMKPVKVFKVTTFKAEPTKAFKSGIEVLKDSGTGQASVQILKTKQEPVQVQRPALNIQKVVPKSKYEANLKYDAMRNTQAAQKVFAKDLPKIETVSKTGLGTNQRFGSLSSSIFGSRSRSSQSSKTGVRSKTGQLSGQSSLQISLVDTGTDTNINKIQRPETIIKTNSLRQTTQYKTPRRPERPPSTPSIKIPSFNLGLSKRGLSGSFSFEIGKAGNKIRKFITSTDFEKGILKAKKTVRTTGAASFRSLKPLTPQQESTAISLLGPSFRKGKKNKSRFVQKREFRISTPGELKDITFKGLRAQRFNKLRFNL